MMRLKAVMRRLGLKALRASAGQMIVEFGDRSRVPPEAVVRALAGMPADRSRLSTDGRLIVRGEFAAPEGIYAEAKNILQRLERCAKW
jgi:transcription-repair coupling factor (superfamily II helicase)